MAIFLEYITAKNSCPSEHVSMCKESIIKQTLVIACSCCLSFTMSCALRLQNTQKVRLDKEKRTVIFQTKTLTGCVYYFPLSVNQFLALDDILAYICMHPTATGYYPMGQNIWLHYYYQGAILYDNKKDARPYFKFDDFQLYKNRLHRKLLSFLRHDDGRRVTKTRHRLVAARKRVLEGEEDDGNDTSKTPDRQRPLPSESQPKTGSQETEDNTTTCNTLPSSPNNVDLPVAGQTCSVLPKRHSPNTRRWDDSDSASSHTSFSVASPDVLCAERWSSLVEMDCD